MNNFKIRSIQNPYIIEERSSNITQLDIFSRLMADRIIFIGSEITDDLANIVTGQLLFLNAESKEKPIDIYINSHGGSVLAGNSILDVMDLISAPVYTTCVGVAASMAAVILSNGQKGNRKALKRSRIMIHETSAINGGKLSEMEISLKEMQFISNELYETLSRNTGKTFDEIKTACSIDNYMSPQEAIDFGLIDKIA